MTKKELCVQVAGLTNVPQHEVEIIVKAALACIEKALVNKDTVRLTEFGQFSTSHATLDVSRNPVYAEAGVQEIAYTKVNFKASVHLKMAVRQN